MRRPSSPLYVLWDAELQEAFNRLAEREGVRRAAQMLDVAERNLYDYRAGLARAGNRKGTVHERKFIGLPVLERLADALDELELEDREALTQREWVDRGEWAWSTNPREGNRFVSREGAA